MIISAISAINSGGRVTATKRVSVVNRDESISYVSESEDLGDVFVMRKRGRSAQPGKDAIRAVGSAASRSSPDVQAALNDLTLGG